MFYETAWCNSTLASNDFYVNPYICSHTWPRLIERKTTSASSIVFSMEECTVDPDLKPLESFFYCERGQQGELYSEWFGFVNLLSLGPLSDKIALLWIEKASGGSILIQAFLLSTCQDWKSLGTKNISVHLALLQVCGFFYSQFKVWARKIAKLVIGMFSFQNDLECLQKLRPTYCQTKVQTPFLYFLSLFAKQT